MTTEKGERPKQEIPQMNPVTGISYDYANTYMFAGLYWSLGDTNAITEGFKKQPAKTYQEWFPEDQYGSVITAQNKKAVERLNILAEQLNTLTSNSNFKKDQFIEIVNEMDLLIAGPDKHQPMTLEGFGEMKK